MLNFTNLPHGTILNEQYAPYGIHIAAFANFPGQNAAIVFNTYASGTPDPDLEVDIGNIMVIARDVFDTNPADGLVDKPNDNSSGGTITITFDNPRDIESFVYIDEEEGSFASAYDAFNNLIVTVPIPALGNSSVQTVLMNAVDVKKLVFTIDGSGGLTEIVFSDCCCDGSATSVVTGGIPPYVYNWSTGSHGSGLPSLCSGTYCLTVADNNGCTTENCVTINETQDLQVIGFTLVYESTYGVIGPLTDGMAISLDQLCRFNVRADLCGQSAKSVKFLLNGNTYRIESVPPFAIAGDNPPGDYNIWNIDTGNYTITAIPYSQVNAGGIAGVPLSVSFTIVDPTPGSTATVCLTPPTPDCNGDLNGSAFIDICGQCAGGNTGITPNPCPCDDVTIVEEQLPEFCQGSTVALNAFSNGAVSFLWSTGETTSSISASPSSPYSVTMTDVQGCTANNTINTTKPGDLLSAYVILATGNVTLERNTVFSGGVGSKGQFGTVKLNDASNVTAPGTFIRAKILQVFGGSLASVQLPTPVPVALPAFEYNFAAAGPNSTVANGATVNLTGSNYGNITIGQNATVTFTQSQVTIGNLTSNTSATIKFSQPCVKLKIKGNFQIGADNTFNPESKDVIVFVENVVLVGNRSDVTADIYTLKSLSVFSGTVLNPTKMTGLFLAASVSADDYTHWHSNFACDCGLNALIAFKTNNNQSENPQGNAYFKVYPNPFKEKLNLEFSLNESSRAKLEVFNVSGQRIAVLFDGNAEANMLYKTQFNPDAQMSGIIYYRLQTDKRTYHNKAIMIK